MSPKYDLIKGNGFAFDGYDKYWNNIDKILETPNMSVKFSDQNSKTFRYNIEIYFLLQL